MPVLRMDTLLLVRTPTVTSLPHRTWRMAPVMFTRQLFIVSMRGLAGNTRDRMHTAMTGGVTATTVGVVKIIAKRLWSPSVDWTGGFAVWRLLRIRNFTASCWETSLLGCG